MSKFLIFAIISLSFWLKSFSQPIVHDGLYNKSKRFDDSLTEIENSEKASMQRIMAEKESEINKLKANKTKDSALIQKISIEFSNYKKAMNAKIIADSNVMAVDIHLLDSITNANTILEYMNDSITKANKDLKHENDSMRILTRVKPISVEYVNYLNCTNLVIENKKNSYYSYIKNPTDKKTSLIALKYDKPNRTFKYTDEDWHQIDCLIYAVKQEIARKKIAIYILVNSYNVIFPVRNDRPISRLYEDNSIQDDYCNDFLLDIKKHFPNDKNIEILFKKGQVSDETPKYNLTLSITY